MVYTQAMPVGLKKHPSKWKSPLIQIAIFPRVIFSSAFKGFENKAGLIWQGLVAGGTINPIETEGGEQKGIISSNYNSRHSLGGVFLNKTERQRIEKILNEIPQFEIDPISSQGIYFKGVMVEAEKFVEAKFSWGEFRDDKKIKKAAALVESDNYGLGLKQTNPLKRLNEILRFPDFYEKWKKSGQQIKEAEIGKEKNLEIQRLISATIKPRSVPWEELDALQKAKIMRLNRLLLEAVYPDLPRIKKQPKLRKCLVKKSEISAQTVDGRLEFYNRTSPAAYRLDKSTLEKRYQNAGGLLMDIFFDGKHIGLIQAVTLTHNPDILPTYLEVMGEDLDFAPSDPKGSIKYCVWLTGDSDTDYSGFEGNEKVFKGKRMGWFLVRSEQIESRQSPYTIHCRTHSPLYIGEYVREKFALQEPEFFAKEFEDSTGKYEAGKLCSALEQKIPEVSFEHSLEGLNAVMSRPNFYDLITKNLKTAFSKEIVSLVKLTNLSRSKNFDALPENEKRNIKWLNRLTLEEALFADCPKSRIFDEDGRLYIIRSKEEGREKLSVDEIGPYIIDKDGNKNYLITFEKYLKLYTIKEAGQVREIAEGEFLEIKNEYLKKAGAENKDENQEKEVSRLKQIVKSAKKVDGVWQIHSENGAQLIINKSGSIMVRPYARPGDIGCLLCSVSYNYGVLEDFKGFWNDLVLRQQRYVKRLANSLLQYVNGLKKQGLDLDRVAVVISDFVVKAGWGRAAVSPFSQEKTQAIINRMLQGKLYKTVAENWYVGRTRKRRIKIKRKSVAKR